MIDSKVPGRGALRVLMALAAAVAAVWMVMFLGEIIGNSRIKAEQQRTGGGVPRGL